MNTKNVFLILFVLIASACSQVRIKDAEWCGDMGNLGASCFHTLTDETRDIPSEEWDYERFGMVCTQPDNFAEWKKAILKLCKISKACTYDAKTKMIHFVDKVERFHLSLEVM